mgnify:CR=1 FL=1
MNFIRIFVSSLAFAFCLSARLAQAQAATNQPAVQSWSGDPRVQSRSYVFTNTGESLPYAVFVSTKVAKDKPAPLVVALRGYGGNPGSFMWGPALNLAEDGGYIMAAPIGYNSGGNFGNPTTGMGAFARRNGASTNAPGAPGASVCTATSVVPAIPGSPGTDWLNALGIDAACWTASRSSPTLGVARATAPSCLR